MGVLPGAFSREVASFVDIIVEHYAARADAPESYELQVFAANSHTVARGLGSRLCRS
jgi:hypothetical protein